jgi:hypothetical protein
MPGWILPTAALVLVTLVVAAFIFGGIAISQENTACARTCASRGLVVARDTCSAASVTCVPPVASGIVVEVKP